MVGHCARDSTPGRGRGGVWPVPGGWLRGRLGRRVTVCRVWWSCYWRASLAGPRRDAQIEQRAVLWERRRYGFKRTRRNLIVIAARSTSVQPAIDQMNGLARKLKVSQVAWASQGDVSSLEARQASWQTRRLSSRISNGHLTRWETHVTANTSHPAVVRCRQRLRHDVLLQHRGQHRLHIRRRFAARLCRRLSEGLMLFKAQARSAPARLLLLVAAVAFVGTTAGCGGVAAAPPSQTPQVVSPTIDRLDPLVEQVAATPVPQLISNSLRRKAEEMVVRVRNVNCEGIAIGSGFALDPHTLLTNRHVLAGASQLEVSTWDGHDYQVSTAKVGALVDLGVATVHGASHRVRLLLTPSRSLARE